MRGGGVRLGVEKGLMGRGGGEHSLLIIVYGMDVCFFIALRKYASLLYKIYIHTIDIISVKGITKYNKKSCKSKLNA